MKIRRKPPKPERAARPHYVVGFTSAPPDLAELSRWFDLHYGGPLRLALEVGAGEAGAATVRAVHGPWAAAFRPLLADAEAEAWREQLGWGHPRAALIYRPALVPAQAGNQVLLAARLARGLTLLTEGTAFDLLSHAYLNPSDWRDRPLDLFRVADHVTVEQAEEGERGWVYTRGLAKLGLDELETFRPAGLPLSPAVERLAEIAEEVARLGRPLPVGSVVPLPLLGLTLRVLRYRTAAPLGATIQLREVAWEA